MTGEPEAPSDQPDELAERRCVRCGAVGTHYLTCPGLRLPAGYRFGDDLRRERRDEALNRR
jgi:hypothetical protein